MSKLKMNSDKTEILVFSSSQLPRPALEFLDIVLENVCCSTTARKIGLIFLYLWHLMLQSSFFHLRNLFKIRKFLSVDTAKTLVHAFVTSKVDYCNSLLYGQPK